MSEESCTMGRRSGLEPGVTVSDPIPLSPFALLQRRCCDACPTPKEQIRYYSFGSSNF